MRGKAQIVSIVTTAILTLSLSHATVINFDNLTLSNGQSIPEDYADRVNSSGIDSQGRGGYNLTYGETPNVQVQMFTADYAGGSWARLGGLKFWATQYSNLQNVAYHDPSNQGARFILTADSTYYVQLHEFQMGGWPNTNRTLPFLQVLVDGNPVYTQTNVSISGSSATTFSFDPTVVKGGAIEIRFGGDWNVGIDNIGFSQELVPEPASLFVLSGGLAELLRARRRARA
ncbi:MAG: hypothetical protein KatS3mg016_0562 [Fimbriimonadales bacterium]|nr:MAG: hypothetical protein KatS3mg016_0562 [Fimbriimonadales bacterium]